MWSLQYQSNRCYVRTWRSGQLGSTFSKKGGIYVHPWQTNTRLWDVLESCLSFPGHSGYIEISLCFLLMGGVCPVLLYPVSFSSSMGHFLVTESYSSALALLSTGTSSILLEGVLPLHWSEFIPGKKTESDLEVCFLFVFFPWLHSILYFIKYRSQVRPFLWIWALR